ncbi:MAG: hypothetical protein Q7K03_04225 [Dehalococcoidia bacterium]|nr:hypothetical protein [Dehalococcoidia bacterium]
MTAKQAQRYFDKNARYQDHGPSAPFYCIHTPDGKFLSDKDVYALRQKFDAAVGVKGA